jgi:hypothetical protein
MPVTQHTKRSEIDAVRAGASAIGRIVWTFFAFCFLVTVWVISTKALLGVHAVWAYAVFAVTTLLFVAAIAALRAVWRDGRYW